MEQELIGIITDFYRDNERQGPGSEASTLRALNFVEGYQTFDKILDIGCGTGAQTLTLAQQTAAELTAVDRFQGFLDVLQDKASTNGIGERIHTEEACMECLPFEDETFDMIWSEGAIYHIGFESGLRQWKRLLRNRGYLVVSEISWLTQERPAELTAYWTSNYAGIDLISQKIETIERCGYIPCGCFTLPANCWDSYYHPIIKKIASCIGKQPSNSAMGVFLDNIVEELYIYQRYNSYYNYVFYIMKKLN